MNLTVIVLTYIVVWCLVLQAALPFGVKPPEKIEEGHDHGAPEKSYLMIKIIITTLLAGCITAGIGYMVSNDIFNIRE